MRLFHIGFPTMQDWGDLGADVPLMGAIVRVFGDLSKRNHLGA